MWEQVDVILRQAAQRTAENVAGFLPGIVGLLVIFLVALIIAVMVRVIVLRALRGLQFDERAERLGLGTVADWSVVGGPSMLVARIAMWAVLVVGLLIGFSALDAALPEAFARVVFAYLPNLLAAMLILLFGVILAQFLARSVLIGAVNLQLPSARLASVGVKWLVLILAWVIALEHLGIGRRILMLAFGILFAGIVLALALAFGLGSQEAVRRMLADRLRRQEEPPDKLTHV